MNQNTVKDLREQTKLKLLIMSMSLSVPIIVLVVLYALNTTILNDSVFVKKSMFGSMPWVPGVVGGLFIVYILAKLFKYIRILKDDEYAKTVAIVKNDERNKFISASANNMASKIFIYVMCVATLVTAFFWTELFLGSLICLIIFIVIKVFVWIVFINKY